MVCAVLIFAMNPVLAGPRWAVPAAVPSAAQERGTRPPLVEPSQPRSPRSNRRRAPAQRAGHRVDGHATRQIPTLIRSREFLALRPPLPTAPRYHASPNACDHIVPDARRGCLHALHDNLAAAARLSSPPSCGRSACSLLWCRSSRMVARGRGADSLAAWTSCCRPCRPAAPWRPPHKVFPCTSTTDRRLRAGGRTHPQGVHLA